MSNFDKPDWRRKHREKQRKLGICRECCGKAVKGKARCQACIALSTKQANKRRAEWREKLLEGAVCPYSGIALDKQNAALDTKHIGPASRYFHKWIRALMVTAGPAFEQELDTFVMAVAKHRGLI